MRSITLFALVAVLAGTMRGADSAAPAAGGPAESEPKLEGVVVERTGGGYMTLSMEGPRAVLRFYNEKKKPVPPDVDRAFVKFRLSGRRPENRTLLPSEDGMYLRHGRPLRPPFVFKAYISLVKESDADDADQDFDEDDEDAEVVSTERYEVDYP